ncbi:MAG TPA: hypothetical protein VHV79_07480 [Mycobacteriales bacterium]|jgi:hypothetical protein|nr:hypothetical protein [Mycobacteriales bacterium]
MPLDPIEVAWVRFVAMRDQLIAARDEENGTRKPLILPAIPEQRAGTVDLREPDLREPDLREVDRREPAWDPRYVGTWRDRRR